MSDTVTCSRDASAAGWLRPLFALLQDREALIQDQAERIRRLEREVETLRAQVTQVGPPRPGQPAPPQPRATPAAGPDDGPGGADPFAEAEAAIRELQRALAAHGAAAPHPAPPPGIADAPVATAAPDAGRRAGAARRAWWRFR